jgi:alkanesulfonate monooxygenase SsuD/methylene tetrahydromethanopterin reductase-like flavin-dependent oxidoreductase (luciferase family)
MKSASATRVGAVRYVVNLLEADVDPREWARRREAEGWDALAVADHVFTATRPYPHVWVTATAMAMVTTRVGITTAFVNNLLRSPVEVAQAARQLQVVSDGRFELGLGAGWADEEITGSGLRYPPPGERAGMYAESARIVRELLHVGSCSFHGVYYDIEVPNLGPAVDTPPLLVGALGGPRTIREVTPHLDRVELKAQSAATRNGSLDLAVMATIPDSHLLTMIEQVRAVRPDMELSMFCLFSVGDDPVTTRVAAAMDEGGLFRRFFGPADHVAEGLAWLETLGIGSVSLSPMTPHSLELLAPHVVRGNTNGDRRR